MESESYEHFEHLLEVVALLVIGGSLLMFLVRAAVGRITDAVTRSIGEHAEMLGGRKLGGDGCRVIARRQTNSTNRERGKFEWCCRTREGDWFLYSGSRCHSEKEVIEKTGLFKITPISREQARDWLGPVGYLRHRKEFRNRRR
jgi:hypothetical protein